MFSIARRQPRVGTMSLDGFCMGVKMCGYPLDVLVYLLWFMVRGARGRAASGFGGGWGRVVSRLTQFVDVFLFDSCLLVDV